MGMEAELICIGKFSRAIVDCLCYPPDHYSDVKEGALVITKSFQCAGTTASRDLAEALCIDPTNLGQHHVTKEQINWHELAVFEIDSTASETPNATNDLRKLFDHGFTCFFMPNY